ncbi:MAG: lyase family protein [Cognatishimia activa]
MAVSLFQSAIYEAQFGDAELSEIFSDRAEAARMVRFERALAQVEGELGVIPQASGQAIFDGLTDASMDLAALSNGVMSSGVAVPALVSELRGQLDPEHGQYLHWGATSQDVVDTAMTLAVAEALDVVEDRLRQLIDALAAKAETYENLVVAGRTRGQIATPITLGLRIAKWAQPLIALEKSLADIRRRILLVQFGGASGGNTATAPYGPQIGEGLAKALGLSAAAPWHVDRTGPLNLASWLLQISVALSKFAGDLILHMRSEIREVTAGAGGGSSTMPQKSNPVGPETIRTLASLAKAAHAGLAGAADPAEDRDGGQWPIEWALLPQIFIAVGASLAHAQVLAETLTANEDQISAILAANDGVMAEQISFMLAEHMPRPEAQALVKAASKTGKPLREALPELCGRDLDWDDLFDPQKSVAPCREIAQSIFAAR